MRNRKPFKTIDEQMQILRSRGLEVTETDRLVLMREGYYAVVNGYKAPFIDRQLSSEKGEDVFVEGTKFEHLHLLFDLDRLLREQTFPLILRAETTVRTALAYCYSERYPGMDSYLDPANYCDQRQYHIRRNYDRDKAGLLRRLRKAHDNEWGHESIDHYLSHHGHVPLWVLVNVLTFGNVSHMYALSTSSVRNAVCRMIAQEQGTGRIGTERMRKAMSVLVDFRNVCAHDDRLYCARTGKSHDKTFTDMLTALELIVRDSDMNLYRKSLHKTLALFDSVPTIKREVIDKMGCEP